MGGGLCATKRGGRGTGGEGGIGRGGEEVGAGGGRGGLGLRLGVGGSSMLPDMGSACMHAQESTWMWTTVNLQLFRGPNFDIGQNVYEVVWFIAGAVWRTNPQHMSAD